MIIFQGVDSKDYGVHAKISGWGTLYERYAVEVIFVILFCFGNFMKFKEKNNIKKTNKFSILRALHQKHHFYP